MTFMPPTIVEGSVESSILQPKPNGRITTLESRVEKLESDLNLLTWLHAELVFGIKMEKVQEVIQNPVFQELLKNAFEAQQAQNQSN